jgi:hypothetical protein
VDTSDRAHEVTLRAFASGLGVQSTAALVLSAQGRIDFPLHLFSNVGDDSENPATLRYFREIATPYAAEHGITLEEIRRVTRDGRTPTLLEDISEQSRSIGIPVRMGTNGAPGTRRCTFQYKTAPITKRLRELGATKAEPAVLGIGFSTDEMQRIGRTGESPFQHRVYPLIELGLSRADCLDVVREAGLPEPPKSSCWFCPFHRPAVWAEMRRDDPELFEAAAELEAKLNARRVQLGRDPVYLTRFGKPIREAIQPAQATLFGPGSSDHEIETCDEGVCFT